MIREPLRVIEPKLNSKKARKLHEQGTMGVYIVSNGEKSIMIGIFYGETGGHEKEVAAQKTDEIIETLVNEVQGHGKIAKCIMGDLNADPEDIPIIEHLMREEGWTDCGAVAEIWGGKSNEPTCCAPNAKK